MQTRLVLDQAPKARDSKIVIATSQDVSGILEHNKTLRSMSQKSDWGRHIAAVPCVILTRWLNEEWARGNVSLMPFGKEFMALVARKLQDPEWKYLRTDDKVTSFMVGYGGN